jgi:ABC-type enterobactin transport system permease subunit
VVLSGELFVVLFAALVARALSGVDGWTILVVSLVVVVLIVAAMATMRRPQTGYVLGSVVQAVLLGSTYWIPFMAVVGLIFTALWVVALVQGHAVDQIRAARLRE